jgi:hypothetical protein
VTDVPASLHGPTLYTPDDDWDPWIGYIRVSTWKEEKISPELQRAAIEAWATRTRRRIVRWIEDLDMTGRNFKRKIMQGIEAVEQREAKGVAVWKYSRFGRNDLGIKINLTRLEHAGGQLASATEEIDVSTAVGKFNRRILFDLAVFESDRAGEMWKDAHAYRRAAGLPATGGRRLGYIWHPRRIPDVHHPGEWIIQREWYEPDPEHQEYVADLYSRNLAGTGYGTLAEGVSARGLRTRQGAMYRADSLRRYMDSGFAAGLLRVHDPECGCDYTAAGGRCTRWVHIDGAHDALITPETWERYQDHRAERRILTPRARVPTYTLTALVRCGDCRGGCAATSARRRGRQVLGYAYQCDTRAHSGRSICTTGVWVQRAVVEDEVVTWLRRQAEAHDQVQPGAPAAPGTDSRARARAERERLQAEADRLAAALTNLRVQRAADPDDWGPGEYEAARDRIRREQETVQAALNAAAEEAAAPRVEDYGPLLLSAAGAWPAMSVEARNRTLRRLIRRVVVTRAAHRSRTTHIEIHPLWEPDPWETSETR